MLVIDAKTIESFVEKALKNLRGDWVLIGGTVLPLLKINYRQTIDIDLVPVESHGNDSLLELMKVAESLKMPIEVINAAGEFYLKNISNWKSRIVLHASTKHCRIFRPSLDLYVELKLARFSESDETDMIHYFQWYVDRGESFNKDLILESINKRKRQSNASEKRRLLRLEGAFSQS